MGPKHTDMDATLTAYRPDIKSPDLDRRSSRNAYMIVLSGSNVGQVYQIDKAVIVVGRGDDADVQVLDGGTSRRHAEVLQDPSSGALILRDLGSHNGTMVNGERIDSDHPLQRGDKIQLGLQTVLRVSTDDEAETQYALNMYHAALRDPLTGAYNRRYFNERLAQAVRHTSAE